MRHLRGGNKPVFSPLLIFFAVLQIFRKKYLRKIFLLCSVVRKHIYIQNKTITQPQQGTNTVAVGTLSTRETQNETDKQRTAREASHL